MTTFSSNLLTGIFGGIAGALMMHQIEKRKTKAVVKEAREEIDNFKETVNEVVAASSALRNEISASAATIVVAVMSHAMARRFVSVRACPTPATPPVIFASISRPPEIVPFWEAISSMMESALVNVSPSASCKIPLKNLTGALNDRPAASSTVPPL